MEKSRKRLPPYVSYRTFGNFVQGLQQRMPARIDRSYWGDTLSGSTGIQLMASLRFLGLVDDYQHATTRLKALVPAKGDQRAQVIREIVSDSFGFVLEGSFEPQSATYSQLEELFHDRYQLAGDMSRKCIKFFIALATDAGIPLSPFITKKIRTTHSSTGTKVITKRTVMRTNRNVPIPQNLEEIPVQIAWDKMLLSKFPAFDPTWPDEIKLKWFAGFDELLKRVISRAEK